MIAPSILALIAAALPEGQVRYRMEIAGEPVGVVDLAIRCAEASCLVSWDARVRAPIDAGGAAGRHRIEVEVDRDGRYQGGAIRLDEDGVPSTGRGKLGAVPATAAEVLLLRAMAAPVEVCLDAFDESSGAEGRACGTRSGNGVAAEVLGVEMDIAPARSGFPGEVRIPEQGARYLADPAARVPAHPPRLHGTEVPGPASPKGRLSFCGIALDPPPPPVASGALPPPVAEGESCREKTARWIARASRQGIEARTAIGVAWDGAAFVWHAWAEAQVGGTWIPVDPTFRQSPARGPRFTVARWEGNGEEGRLEAGRRILACWGRAGVEAAPGGGTRSH